MADTQTVIRRNVRLDFPHSVHFTREAFLTSNDTLAEILRPPREGLRTKLIVYLDEGLLDGNPNLPTRIEQYFRAHEEEINLVCPPVFIRGGEPAKNNWHLVESIWSDLNERAMCRHSYVMVVGGGAALDLVGFAASTAHRGVRLVRLPTTTLSQGDGGIGVDIARSERKSRKRRGLVQHFGGGRDAVPCAFTIGGGQRAESLDFLQKKIAEHNLPEEAFDWYLDLRRYGSVPQRPPSR